jgi:hypothetical protein
MSGEMPVRERGGGDADYRLAVRMKIGVALAVVLVFGQCQSPVEALRFESFVPVSGRLEVGSNAGYSTDALWFPAQQIECVVLHDRGDEEEPSRPSTRWIVRAARQPSINEEHVEPVQVPAALAARIFALVDTASVSDEEAGNIAEEGRLDGLFRIGMSEIERALQIWGRDR